jgi:hypothetical protein
MKYTSINMDPNGKIPPRKTNEQGSRNHFFSGIGRGTVLTRQGVSGCPIRFLPNMVPIKFNGKIMNKAIPMTDSIEVMGIALDAW